MAQTFVYFKDIDEDLTVSPSIQSVEPIVNLTITQVLPAGITATVDNLSIKLSGGLDGVGYGIQVKAQTANHTISLVLAVNVGSDISNVFGKAAYQSPDAFQDLLGTIEAGQAAVAVAIFTLPPEVDPSGGYVTWELLGQDHTYNQGNAFEYKVQTNGNSNVVVARSVVSVPSSVEPNVDGTKYQLRYTLNLDPETSGSGQERFYMFEQLEVEVLNTTPLGTEDIVELTGNPAQAVIVVDQLYDNVGINVWTDGQMLTPMFLVSSKNNPQAGKPVKVSSGYEYKAVINTVEMPPSLVPYTVVWSYWNDRNPQSVYTESAPMFIINPSIMQAIDDVRRKINKAATTLYGTPDLLFPESTILTWLRRGMDYFNGYQGKFTNFTMINARGPVRSFWLQCAELFALESQYLAEGEKAFDFQGQAIQLSVDKTQYLDQAASVIRGRLDNELKPFKENLIIKGVIDGDGSVDPASRLASVAVGIAITHAWNGPVRFHR